MSRRRGMRCEGGARVRVRHVAADRVALCDRARLRGGARRSSTTARRPPGVLAGELVESRHQRRAGRCAIAADHRFHQRADGHEQDAGSTSSPGLRSSSVRDPLRCRRRRSAAGDARARRLRRRERCRARPGLPGYPIPVEARTTANYIEGGEAGGGVVRGSAHARDRPRSMAALRDLRNPLERDAGTVGSRFRRPSSTCHANDRRPDGWTSADAAGLAIFPGLVRYDEVFGAAEITHAFRVTTRATNGLGVARIACGWHERGRAADGRAAAAEGSRRTFPAFTPRSAANLPRDEALRSDRGGQRVGHVHQRIDGWRAGTTTC